MQQELNRRSEEESNRDTEPTYQSDADRIIHRHLMDKNDIITDEDLRNIRVGSGPVAMDNATLARFEENEQVEGLEKRIDEEPNAEQGPNGSPSGANPITPWDLEKE